MTNTPSKRDVVKGLSVPSGMRLQKAIASVDPVHGDPLVVCLTYPAKFDIEWTEWKRHLHNFRQSLFDNFGSVIVGGIWRLEAQKRGAPHYHLLLWHRFNNEDRDTIDNFREWIADTWYRIVGSGDTKHLRAGTSVEPLDKGKGGINAAMAYMSKYLGKDATHPESQVFDRSVGRYWGIWRKNDLILPSNTIELDRNTYLKIRRDLRHYRDSKVKNYKKKKQTGTKEGFNKTRKKHIETPGCREFIDEKTSLHLLQNYDPAPF